MKILWRVVLLLFVRFGFGCFMGRFFTSFGPVEQMGEVARVADVHWAISIFHLALEGRVSVMRRANWKEKSGKENTTIPLTDASTDAFSIYGKSVSFFLPNRRVRNGLLRQIPQEIRFVYFPPILLEFPRLVMLKNCDYTQQFHSSVGKKIPPILFGTIKIPVFIVPDLKTLFLENHECRIL
jgi:hypothetical protein